MGLRDRLSANYYLPLVAGVDSAARAGLLAPPEVYAPGLCAGGSGCAGGIGLGDGGDSTPDDPTVNQPSITAPTCASTNVDVDADATSSAFGSTNGQTHIRSRWVIEQRTGTGTPEPMIVYDSGPTNDDLTLLSLTPANIGRGITYAIKVRHKGSNGGWSPWSAYCTFTTRGCGSYNVTCTQYQSVDAPYPDYAYPWLDSQQAVADDLANSVTVFNNNGITYVGIVDGGVVKVTNPTSPGGCTGLDCFVVWTSTGFNERTGEYCSVADPCVPMPPAAPPDPSPPPPTVVPPVVVLPPQPDPPPGTPETQEGFANIVLDAAQSLVIGRSVLQGDTLTLQATLNQGGRTIEGNYVEFVLLFQNTGNLLGSINFAVTTDSVDVQIAPSGVQQVFVGPNAFVTVPVQCTNSTGSTETRTFTIDVGSGSPITVDIGFGYGDYGGP